ncbi:unnamed protein product [Diabrotica balteata]|uniref:Uncharacterized protein n=1 Tax=Diabrotica balteata TaxID=107213 RepID=A0A9N9TCP3_DIABA|nr:unnamed protein product [Diabrotica balteata]
MAKATFLSNDLNYDSSASSPALSIPEEYRKIFESDDSDQDPNYIPIEKSGNYARSKTPTKKMPNKKQCLGTICPGPTTEAENKNILESLPNEYDGETSNRNDNEVESSSGVSAGNHFTSNLYKQKNRNLGKEYTTKTGKIVKKRERRKLLECRSKCSTLIEINMREKIFDEYWQIGDFNRRLAYIAGLLNFKEPKQGKVGKLLPHLRYQQSRMIPKEKKGSLGFASLHRPNIQGIL